ncbi:hypothetical protein D7V86_00750 [bacterium D16-51]|nr:hypothetical protein D7V96_04570 [bacterium D16-59]RKI62762.1 hypothetical protein D7V86_00750 [bacterium D16-51]
MDMKRSKRKWMPVFMAGVLAAGCMVGHQTAEAKKKVDLGGTYHAALGISTATDIWMNRYAYYAKKPNKYYKTDQWKMLMSEDRVTGEPTEHKGTFTDAVIKGNGRYTVKLEKADFEGETTISMLHVATDIPVNNKITFSNVTAKINKKTIVTFEEPYMEKKKKYLSGGMDIILMDHGREDLVRQLSGRGVTESGANGYDLLKGTGRDSVEVTFTVSGFHYDKGQKSKSPIKKPEKVETTPEAIETQLPEASFSPEPVSSEKSLEMQGTTPTASAPILAVVISAVFFCGVVIVIVNGRRKRK